MNNKDTILTIAIVILVASIAWSNFTGDGESIFGGNGITERACDVSSTEVATVGNQESLTVVAAAGRRASVIISQQPSATNTVSLSFDEGAAAIVNEGYVLDVTNTTTTPPQEIQFGLNTDFPYVGEVTGITDAGSTTVLLTICNY